MTTVDTKTYRMRFEDRPTSTVPTPDLIAVFDEALARVSTASTPAEDRASINELLEWLDSEDFGDDPGRIRANAWR